MVGKHLETSSVIYPYLFTEILLPFVLALLHILGGDNRRHFTLLDFFVSLATGKAGCRGCNRRSMTVLGPELSGRAYTTQ